METNHLRDYLVQNPVVRFTHLLINNNPFNKRNKMGKKNILKKMNYIDKKIMNRQQRRKLERERKKKVLNQKEISFLLDEIEK